MADRLRQAVIASTMHVKNCMPQFADEAEADCAALLDALDDRERLAAEVKRLTSRVHDLKENYYPLRPCILAADGEVTPLPDGPFWWDGGQACRLDRCQECSEDEWGVGWVWDAEASLDPSYGGDEQVKPCECNGAISGYVAVPLDPPHGIGLDGRCDECDPPDERTE